MIRRSYIIIFMAAMIVAFLVARNTSRKPSKLDWNPYYNISTKKPLGLYVLNKEANNLFSEKTITRVNGTPGSYFNKLIEKKEYAANTFVFIGDEMPWEKEEIENLLTAVDAGMNGFISLNEFPGSMLEKLELRMQEDNESAFVRLSIEEGDSVNIEPAQSGQFNSYFMSYFLPIGRRSRNVLGRNGRFPNFIKVFYGEGTILLHCSPAVFSNYYLLKSDIKPYTESVLSMLPGKKIVWFTGVQQSNISGSPLSFILANPPLRYALYMIVAGVMLFILFNAKRRQRVITVKTPNRNTSVEFVRTIGNLYYQKISIPDLLKMRLGFLKERLKTDYQMSLDQNDAELIDRLSNKTGKPVDLITGFVDLIRDVEAGPPDSKQMLTQFEQYIYRIFILK